jgi:dimethylaniline monooxygenase (N-oxide forming)
MELGDFPFPFQPANGDFPTRREICRYVEAYAAHFGVSEHVRFRCTVRSASPVTAGDPSTAWLVDYVNADGAARSETFGALFCANGQFSRPKLPAALRDATAFAGEVIHSQQFVSGQQYKGKRVVVVGIGNSALDVGLECAQCGAESVTVACRRGSILLPIMTDERRALDQRFVSRAFQYMLPGWARGLYLMHEAMDVTAKFVKAGMPPPDSRGQQGLHQRISNLKQKQAWLNLVRSGEEAGGGVLRFQGAGVAKLGPGDEVTFSDGSVMGADIVIACTGYQLGFPFLPASVVGPVMMAWEVPMDTGGADPPTNVQALNLYKRVMHPALPTLCFLTQLTCFANEAALGGLQARWAIAALSGSNGGGALLADMRLHCEDRRSRFMKSRPLFPGFVTYPKYADDLAADVGCLPPPLSSPWTWLNDPVLAWRLLVGPLTPAHYCLNASEKSARETAMALIRDSRPRAKL